MNALEIRCKFALAKVLAAMHEPDSKGRDFQLDEQSDACLDATALGYFSWDDESIPVYFQDEKMLRRSWEYGRVIAAEGKEMEPYAEYQNDPYEPCFVQEFDSGVRVIA